jgi:hypothetical protein
MPDSSDDPSSVNPQVVAAIQQAQIATLDPGVVGASGAGKAYQSVAQTAALAVQDAADHLRNLSTLSATALGVAMAHLLATGDPKYLKAIEIAQGMMKSATDDFQRIGSAAAEVLRGFPSK